MAFKLVSGFDHSLEFPVGASSGILAGDVCVWDVANNVVIPATAALLQEDLAGVAVKDAPSAAGMVDLVPICGGSQLWEWDCTNSTNADQLCQRSLLTDARTVANTTTEQAVDEVTVIPIKNVGAASNKKQRGFLGLQAPAVS